MKTTRSIPEFQVGDVIQFEPRNSMITGGIIREGIKGQDHRFYKLEYKQDGQTGAVAIEADETCVKVGEAP